MSYDNKMPKVRFVFKKLKDKDNTFDTCEVTFKSCAITTEELFADFRDFLRGSGFVVEGEIGIVNEEE